MGYAVVDVETTGLSPRNDRIVEIGVVVLDDSGEAEDEWSSLVNPGRSMRATFIHGLTDADVTDAPVLADLLPRIRATFAGRALVAHNASFDVGFLNASFARASHPAGGDSVHDGAVKDLSPTGKARLEGCSRARRSVHAKASSRACRRPHRSGPPSPLSECGSQRHTLCGQSVLAGRRDHPASLVDRSAQGGRGS